MKIGKNLEKRFGEKGFDIAEEFDEYIMKFADKHGLEEEEIIELMIGYIDYGLSHDFGEEGKIEKILTPILNKDFYEALRHISDYILIVNWYDREDLEDILGGEVSEEEYNEIVNRWNTDGLLDEANELIRDFYGEWFEEE